MSTSTPPSTQATSNQTSPNLTSFGIVKRFFTQAGVSPEEMFSWETRDAVLITGSGQETFRQDNVEVPAKWSPRATAIVAKHYFRGVLGSSSRECSVKQVATRVASTIGLAGVKQGLLSEVERVVFEDELRFIIYSQMASFNSPVWYNVGVEDKPQSSGCFILDVDDALLDNDNSIIATVAKEARIFKFGSGSGTNLSKIREDNAPMSGGGAASGVLSWMKTLDVNAGSIKSGGRTRRAACMRILDTDHPDIVEFINLKAIEEDKIQALIAAGYDSSLGGIAEQTVTGQNANNSVRASDEFMRRALSGDEEVPSALEDSSWTLKSRVPQHGGVDKTVDAKDIFNLINQNSHKCADPGLQFHDTINVMNTCKVSGDIRGSNPCASGDTLLMTDKGLLSIADLAKFESFKVLSGDGVLRESRAFYTSEKDVYRVTLSSGHFIDVTADHKILSDGESSKGNLLDLVDMSPERFVEAAYSIGKTVRLATLQNQSWEGNVLKEEVSELLGFAFGDGSPPRYQPHAIHNAFMYFKADGSDDEVLSSAEKAFSDFTRVNLAHGAVHLKSSILSSLWVDCGIPQEPVQRRQVPKFFLESNTKTASAFLRGWFSANGCVLEKHKRVQLKATCKEAVQKVLSMLAMFGIRAYFTTNKSRENEFSNGVFMLSESYDVCITRANLEVFYTRIGFLQTDKQEKLRKLVEEARGKPTTVYNKVKVKSVELIGKMPVYDFTEKVNSCGGANGIVVHNCSEFMFLDNTGCNLATINLCSLNKKQFGLPDPEIMSHVCDTMLTAQEILVDMSSYPTSQIDSRTRKFRPLGLGYGNLGALLMANGVAYDSDEGRRIAGSLASLLTARAYRDSACFAEIQGPFSEFKINSASVIEVLEIHKKSTRDLLKLHTWPLVPKRLNGSSYNPTGYVSEIADCAIGMWEEAIARIEEHGVRNAQVSVLAPTGTISFFMDFDTTGVEPSPGLVTFKTMVDGSVEAMVFCPVQQALKKVRPELTDAEVLTLVNHAVEYGSIEHPSVEFTEEERRIFQCAFPSADGTGDVLKPEGHVLMMAAIQPFISGAISKTVNLPKEATVESFYEIHKLAWMTGVKSIACYRDGSKSIQPIQSSKEKVEVRAWGERLRLPADVNSKRHKFKIGANCSGFIHMGVDEDGDLREVFIEVAKTGGTLRGITDSFGIALSHCLQLGMPLEELVSKYIWSEFEPQGFTNNKEIPSCTSIVDYVVKLLATRYLGHDYSRTVATAIPALDSKEQVIYASGVCACGGMLQRNGTCLVCIKCGETSGCS